MCNLITHNLAFIKVLTFSKKQVKIQNSVPSIDWTFFSIDQKMKKFIIKSLPDSIDSRFLFDQLKRTFDRLKGILNRSRLVKLNFFQNFLVIVFDVFTFSIKNIFWFYKRKLIDQTLRVSRSRTRTLIC